MSIPLGDAAAANRTGSAATAVNNPQIALHSHHRVPRYDGIGCSNRGHQARRYFYGRAINIHHSSYQSFNGAKGYNQAHARGVKLMGVSAHHVTTDLDNRPIIEQRVGRVYHTKSPQDLIAIGSELETVVLNRDIKWHPERLIFRNDGRTVVLKYNSANMVKRVQQEWLELAREMLIRGGVEAVTVQSISRELGVTRGGFYGYFGSRDALLKRLLQNWKDVNSRALRRIAARGRTDGEAQFKELINMWVEDEDYSPEYDSAVRDWARRSPDVARQVKLVDNERIRLIERIFHNLGFRGLEAHIRARITYYHQVGYYALAVHESRPTRRRLTPIYTVALMGRKL